MNRTKLLAVLAFLFAAPAIGAQQQYGRDSDIWRWDGRVDSGRWMHVFNLNGTVEFTPSSDNMVHWMHVFNLNGTVEFTPSSDNMVHLVAEKRSNGREMDDIHYEVVQTGGNVTICAIWYNNSRCEDGDMQQYRHNDHNENHSSVKFTVRVPRGVKVGAHSVNGGVSVRDVGAEVRANTVNGGVTVRNANGPVRATTVNGSVSIYVPARFDANFRFDTVHGGIDSDFPLTISGRWGPRHASGRIGNGGRDIRASSVNGSIELRKQ